MYAAWRYDCPLLTEAGKALRADIRIAVFSCVVNTFAGSVLVPRVLRVVLLRAAGIRVSRAQIHPNVTFTTRYVSFGQSAYVNRGCFFDSRGGISIGARVHIGYGAMLCTSTHTPGEAACRAGAPWTSPIVVEDGCWIGARVVILPGVTIGSGCIIASGAVVTKNCGANGLYGGVPAERKRELRP